MCPGPHWNLGRGWRCEKPPVGCFADHSRAVVLLWIFYVFFCLVFVMPLCGSVYLCLVVTCWERADLLFVVCNCEFVTFPLVSLVRCGTLLYRFLISAPLITLTFNVNTILIFLIHHWGNYNFGVCCSHALCVMV